MTSEHKQMLKISQDILRAVPLQKKMTVKENVSENENRQPTITSQMQDLEEWITPQLIKSLNVHFSEGHTFFCLK